MVHARQPVAHTCMRSRERMNTAVTTPALPLTSLPAPLALLLPALSACYRYDGQNPEYLVLRSPELPVLSDPVPLFTSTLWGPTCDSADVVYKDVQLPALRNGDWLAFPDAGAYTVAGACDFNGIAMTRPRLFYVFSDAACDAPVADAM